MWHNNARTPPLYIVYKRYRPTHSERLQGGDWWEGLHNVQSIFREVLGLLTMRSSRGRVDRCRMCNVYIVHRTLYIYIFNIIRLWFTVRCKLRGEYKNAKQGLKRVYTEMAAWRGGVRTKKKKKKTFWKYPRGGFLLPRHHSDDRHTYLYIIYHPRTLHFVISWDSVVVIYCGWRRSHLEIPTLTFTTRSNLNRSLNKSKPLLYGCRRQSHRHTFISYNGILVLAI